MKAGAIPEDGRILVRASAAGTAVFVVAAVLATLAPGDLGDAFAVLSLGLFGVGTVAFIWAFLVAVNRSRVELIGVGGLYFLAGCAPTAVQRAMMASLGVEVVVALVAASIRPYTAVAFGILVPMYGLGLAGLWGARHGTFPPRAAPAPPDAARADPSSPGADLPPPAAEVPPPGDGSPGDAPG